LLQCAQDWNTTVSPAARAAAMAAAARSPSKEVIVP
jgi:hypothetical protein